LKKGDRHLAVFVFFGDDVIGSEPVPFFQQTARQGHSIFHTGKSAGETPAPQKKNAALKCRARSAADALRRIIHSQALARRQSGTRFGVHPESVDGPPTTTLGILGSDLNAGGLFFSSDSADFAAADGAEAISAVASVWLRQPPHSPAMLTASTPHQHLAVCIKSRIIPQESMTRPPRGGRRNRGRSLSASPECVKAKRTPLLASE